MFLWLLVSWTHLAEKMFFFSFFKKVRETTYSVKRKNIICSRRVRYKKNVSRASIQNVNVVLNNQLL